jgi:murein DD-endopeptidase MepM/ murein hydrolase activator NlpD
MMPIPALSKATERTEDPGERVPRFETRTERVQEGDSLSRLFSRQRLGARMLHSLTQAETEQTRISQLKVGQSVEFRYRTNSTLAEIAVIHSPFHQTIATQNHGGWTIRQEYREAEIYIEHAQATIDSSLFLAGARAGLSDNLIMELADIYGHVIDFVYEIRKGDRFAVTFEKRYLDGQFIEYGNILAAEFINSGESFIAVRFEDAKGDVGYYDQDGVSLRKAFLRAPLNFRRISSNFNLNRKHPVLGTMRAHKGTDYAASTGTPIYAAGDGKVTFRGRKGGYGRLIVMKHGSSIETRYAHLARFGRFRSGHKVRQGQVIGYVGMSGMATGPHLHYEFIVNGVHRNPRTILNKLPKAKSLPKSEIARYKSIAGILIASLDAQRSHDELAFQSITKP